MEKLREAIRERLKGAKKIAVLGIGSELRGDDAAGMLVAQKLKDIKIFLGGTAPENLTGEIKKYNPTHLVIIDSADFGEKPGAANIIEPEDIRGTSFSTHRMPLKVMVEYLRSFLDCGIIIIGIQPGSIEFGKPVSFEVKKSAQKIAGIIQEICEQ